MSRPVLREGLFVRPEGSGPPSALRASRCRGCGDLRCPFVPRCVICDGATDETALSATGRVFEATTVRSPAPGFEGPYDVGYVDLPEGVRVFAWLEAPGGVHARAGDAVRMVLREFPDERGGTALGYAFTADRP